MARSGAGPAGAAGGRDRGGEGRRPEERGWAGHGEVRIPRGARAAEGAWWGRRVLISAGPAPLPSGLRLLSEIAYFFFFHLSFFPD